MSAKDTYGDREEHEDIRCEVGLNKVPQMFKEDITQFDLVTPQENINRKIIEEVLEVEGNATDLGCIHTWRQL